MYLPFDDKTFRYFNTVTNRFEEEAGVYQLYLGASSADIRLVGEIERAGTTTTLPDGTGLSSYQSGQVSQVSDDEFARLLGRSLPVEAWTIGQELRLNDPLSKMQYARSGLARLVYKVL